MPALLRALAPACLRARVHACTRARVRACTRACAFARPSPSITLTHPLSLSLSHTHLHTHIHRRGGGGVREVGPEHALLGGSRDAAARPMQSRCNAQVRRTRLGCTCDWALQHFYNAAVTSLQRPLHIARCARAPLPPRTRATSAHCRRGRARRRRRRPRRRTQRHRGRARRRRR